MDWVLFSAALVPSLLLMVLAMFYRAYPPKSINFFYGYRTRKSMRNQQTWDFANRIAAKMLFYVGASTLMVATATYFVDPLWAFGVSIFFLLVAMFAGIFWCERQLALNFDKDGKPLK
jgi:uncharacterized membrane protein